MEIQKFEKKFIRLPWFIKIKIALKLPIDGIVNLCLTSKIFNEEICENQYFWRKLYKKYYKFPLETNNWRKASIRMALFTFGDNSYGQLGTGGLENRHEPTPLQRAKFIACGEDHTILIDLDNDVFTFGKNDDGELGLGDRISKSVPTQILIDDIPFKAKFAAAGYGVSFLIDLDNNIWAFGRNDFQKLGLPDPYGEYLEPSETGLKGKSIACADFYTLIIDLEDNVWEFGKNNFRYYIAEELEYGPISEEPFLLGIKAKQIACGFNHSLILDIQGNIFGFGNNRSKQLGMKEDFLPELTPLDRQGKYIACGTSNSFFIDMEGNTWAFGLNSFGQLGLGITQSIIETPQQIPNLEVEAIASRGGHTLFLDSENNIWGSGFDGSGQLGIGESVSEPTQIQGFKAIQIAAGVKFSAFVGYENEI